KEWNVLEAKSGVEQEWRQQGTGDFKVPTLPASVSDIEEIYDAFEYSTPRPYIIKESAMSVLESPKLYTSREANPIDNGSQESLENLSTRKAAPQSSLTVSSSTSTSEDDPRAGASRSAGDHNKSFRHMSVVTENGVLEGFVDDPPPMAENRESIKHTSRGMSHGRRVSNPLHQSRRGSAAYDSNAALSLVMIGTRPTSPSELAMQSDGHISPIIDHPESTIDLSPKKGLPAPEKLTYSLQEVMELTLLHTQQLEMMQREYS
ncbi:hypothetical protein HDU93_002190, partial [Gonapodya sp. JEL0774]